MGDGMNILLTLHCDIDTIGGTQTWVKTVARELMLRGHHVGYAGRSVAAKQEVGFANPTPRFPTGFKTWQDFDISDPTKCTRFDLAIVSQNSTFEAARKVAERVIFVSHGIGEMEMPPISIDPPIEPVCVYVSEESQRWTPGHGHVIRQPIDTEYWKPHGMGVPIFDVLRVSYHRGMAWLPKLCSNNGWTFYHARNESTGSLRSVMRTAGVVIASGRSALEAMSCGAKVIVADERSYNGKALMATDRGTMQHNYSGRGGIEATPERIESAIKMRGAIAPQREHVFQHHDVRKIVTELLAVA